jgi:hypothetical protein
MLVDGWLRGSYIIIDRDGNVMDGQHRLAAAMKANVPVDYIMEKSAKIGDIFITEKGTKTLIYKCLRKNKCLVYDPVKGKVNRVNVLKLAE